MRPDRTITRWRRSRLGAGALMLAGPSCAAAVLAGQALAAPAQEPVQIVPQPVRVPYGENVIARGTAPAAEAGDTIVLEFARPGQSTWRALSSSTIGPDGRFSLAGAPERSGAVRSSIPRAAPSRRSRRE